MSDICKPYFTIEEMVSLPMYSHVSVSRDGSRVAYVERLADWDENRYADVVWAYDVSHSHKHRITSDATGGLLPKWSPDGRILAYLRLAGDGDKRKTQLFVKSDDDASGFQITAVKDGVHTYQWSPDGRGLYYLSTVHQPELEKRQKDFGDIEYVDLDDYRKTLYYVALDEALEEHDVRFQVPKDLRGNGADNAESGVGSGNGSGDGNGKHDAERLEHPQPVFNRPDLHILDFDITDDCKTIVFTAAPSTNFEDIDKVELYRFDGAGAGASDGARKVGASTQEDASTHEVGARCEILKTSGMIGDTVYLSPDGSRFVFTRQTGDGKMFRNSSLNVYHLDTGDIQTIPVEIDEDLRPVAWTERGIVVEWQNHTNRWIEFVNEDGSHEAIAVGVGMMAFGVSVSRDGHRAAWVQASIDAPEDVVVDGERITGKHETFAGKTTSKKQLMQWQASDGVEIEGVLSLPRDFDEGKRYPLLVVIHGGPTWASFPSATNSKYYPIEQFVEKGFIVLEPNYRGSTGYGEAFRSLNEKNLGLGDYDDVISGVDALIEKGWADSDKVGVMGWSQGGYISAFCTTYSRRFKAVSVGAGISNWMTYYVNTDIHPFTRHYLGDNPWNDPEVYAKTSPMTYIKDAVTPTLIQHGNHDTRVPVPNAYELYQGLRDVGAPVKLVIFKGMQHGSNKPGWNRAIMHQNLAWFSHYILGNPLDKFRLV